MKKAGILTIVLFAMSQLLLAWVAENDHLNSSSSEILIESVIIGVFIILHANGVTWARWVAIIFLNIFGLILLAAPFKGFSGGLISVGFIYAAVIFSMFYQSSPAATIPDDVIDMEETPVPEPIETPGKFEIGDQQYEYPMLVKRYQSVFIDYLLIMLIMVVTMVITTGSAYRQPVMLSLGFIFLFVYEPLMVTYSATIGQRVTGIRVRSIDDPEYRLNLLQAYIRIIVKIFLGWLSFITINFNPEHRAIHDFAGSSVVILIKPDDGPA